MVGWLGPKTAVSFCPLLPILLLHHRFLSHNKLMSADERVDRTDQPPPVLVPVHVHVNAALHFSRWPSCPSDTQIARWRRTYRYRWSVVVESLIPRELEHQSTAPSSSLGDKRQFCLALTKPRSRSRQRTDLHARSYGRSLACG